MRTYTFIGIFIALSISAFAATQTVTVKVDEDGVARAYIKGLQENDIVNISAKTSDPLVPAKNGEVIVKNYASEVELPTYSSTLYGTEADTADYKEDFTITASNLMPGTTVKWSATNGITPKSEETIVGDDGKTSVEFNANADYSIKNTDITMEYRQSSSKTITATKTLNFKQYILALTTDKTEIVGDEQYVATLSGGKPGEAVEWSVTGDSELVSKQDVFDENGKATYIAQGKSPFNDIIINAKTDFDDLNAKVLFIFMLSSQDIVLDTVAPIDYQYLTITSGKPGTSVELTIDEQHYIDSDSHQHFIDIDADISAANKVFDNNGIINIKFVNNCGNNAHKGIWLRYKIYYPYKEQTKYVTLMWE